MRKIFSLKSFWIVFAASSVVLLIALLNFNRAYESEATVIVIPKNGVAAISINQIVENLKELPRTTSFFSRALESRPAVFESLAKETTFEKKKAAWDRKIEVERAGTSTLIKVSAKDQSPARAQEFVEITTQNLLSSAGIFYDIKNEAEIKIVDASRTFPALTSPSWFLVLSSLASGFFLALFSFFVSFSFFEKEKDAPRRVHFSPEDSFQKDEKREMFRWPSKVSAGVSQQTGEEAVWTIEKKMTPEKKATPPVNLPVAPEEPNDFDFPEKKIVEDAKKETSAPIIKEATPEEVKERLNKLLSGKL